MHCHSSLSLSICPIPLLSPLSKPPLPFFSPFSFSLTSKSTSYFPVSCSSSSSSSVAVKNKRKRYRKAYPGEAKGIVEEMRFVAMKLRNNKNGKKDEDEDEDEDENEETWRPSMEGFVKYLVDSRVVFQTLERIIDESSHVSYTHFRKIGLERSASISKDLEWFEQQGIEIPEPSSPGITYATYLEELAEKSAPSFLCHLYNIYFAHISGGQAIGKQVFEKLSLGRELEFYKWEGDAQDLLSGVREKLNKLGEHWTRDEKNKCLREAAKSFRFSGQIVRLIIL